MSFDKMLADRYSLLTFIPEGPHDMVQLSPTRLVEQRFTSSTPVQIRDPVFNISISSRKS